MEAILRTHGLRRCYGDRVAVSDLDLDVRRGEVFGFLGPNGAGKTTTIRMLLGLVRPTQGRVELFGQDLRTCADAVLPRVGALIETPALYRYLSGRDNLRAFAGVLGGVTPRRLDEVLRLVGLVERQRDRVGSYSLGMRQRLGIAAALVNDPDLLILDEPANGLDPAGIVEMRTLLRRVSAAGRTVFVSSHMLAEVQEMCDRVAIIDRGRLRRVAPVRDLVAAEGEVALTIEGARDALSWIRSQPWGRAARLEEERIITPAPPGGSAELLRLLSGAGYWADALEERRERLEDVFLRLTGGAA